MRPTVAEIRLGALLHNYRVLEGNVRAHAGAAARLLAVVKADAYGHGVERCGRALVQGAGSGWLGVTSVEEAVLLRGAVAEGLDEPAAGTLQAGPTGQAAEARKRPRLPHILVMSGFFAGEEDEVVRRGFRPQVWEPWHFERLDSAARRASFPPRPVSVHLEIDTGMSRQGIAAEDAAELFARSLPRDSPVFVEGVLTHFSSPEELGSPVMEEQIARLRGALAGLQAAGVRPRWIHAGNSANALAGRGLEALAALAQEHGAKLLVRPGLALYGVETRFTPALAQKLVLEPVMQWRTEVVSLREVEAGTPVGYNETFRAPGRMRLATVPVGYADGLRRALSNRGWMLVRGCRVPIVGRVSMDQTVLDVTGVPAAAMGDEVMLIGEQNGERVTASEHAEWAGTIPYEVVCGVGARVPRVEEIARR